MSGHMQGAFGLQQQVEFIPGPHKVPASWIDAKEVKIVLPNGDTRTRHVNKVVHGEREVEGVYMVYFPRGHSICVASDDTATIAKLGLTQEAALVDYAGEGGIELDNGAPRTPKQAVAAALARRGGRQGGLTELKGE